VDLLQNSLLDLLYELRDVDFPLTVGGGFGLFLKRLHLNATGSRTLFQELPHPRATNDLDLFIRVEVLVDHARMQHMADALQRLRYEVVPDAKYLQWQKAITVGGTAHELKVDFLVGPLGRHRAALHVKKPRVRPKKPIELHAYSVEEALNLEEDPLALTLDGNRTSGEPYRGVVYVPHPFSYLLMKLSAFADRKDDANRNLGSHHALDVYTIVGMLTEEEYERARELGTLHAGSTHLSRTRMILENFFADSNDIGLLRLKEHDLYRADFRLEEMTSVLREIFPEPT
jgi:hypothetical protein